MIRAKRTFVIGTIEAKENLTWNHYSIESRGVSLNHFNIGTTARRSQENFTTAMGTACRNQWNLSKQRNESALKNHSRAPENPNNKDPRRLHKPHRNCKLQEPREPMEPLLFQRSLCFLHEGNWRDQEIQENWQESRSHRNLSYMFMCEDRVKQSNVSICVSVSLCSRIHVTCMEATLSLVIPFCQESLTVLSSY